MLGAHGRLDHESGLRSLELLVVGGEALLAPAELNEFLLVLLGEGP